MVGTLDSGLGGLDFRPGWVIVLCSWAKHFTLKMLLSTRSRNGYWWIVREVWWNGRGSFGVDCLSIHREAGWGGEVIVLLVSSFYGNQDKLELDGPLGLGVDFTLPLPKGFRRWRRLENSRLPGRINYCGFWLGKCSCYSQLLLFYLSISICAMIGQFSKLNSNVWPTWIKSFFELKSSLYLHPQIG